MADKPYGMGGCGLGSQLMGKEGNQILAITTNGTGTNTFAISSGTSNCVTAAEQTALIKNFIEANHHSLVTDMAKGQGDSVKTLASFYGCDSDLFASKVQQNFETITNGKESATQIMVHINTMIENNDSLNAKCTHVI